MPGFYLGVNATFFILFPAAKGHRLYNLMYITIPNVPFQFCLLNISSCAIAATAQLRKHAIKSMPQITVANEGLLQHLAELEINIKSLVGAHY